jgi:hypothetical protein
VPISEAARHDLYTGLAELLGPERTETLMSALPSCEISDVATKGDIALLSARIDGLEMALGAGIDRLEARMDRLEARMDRLEARMDRFFVALVAGMFLIMATLIGGFFTF